MITAYEYAVLCHLGGREVEGLQWGAALSAAVSSLKSMGYVEKRMDKAAVTYGISEAGRELIKSIRWWGVECQNGMKVTDVQVYTKDKHTAFHAWLLASPRLPGLPAFHQCKVKSLSLQLLIAL
jgi:hypothetical protein